MPELTGPLRKMRVRGCDAAVEYWLRVGKDEMGLAGGLGRRLTLRYAHEIRCAGCGALTPRSYGQGFCYRCFTVGPESSECIIRPELCRGHLGEGRDPEWERLHHVQEHVVYVALTSAAKVGVTRASEIPTRWIDQGAVAAVVLARTPYRELAGRIEVACGGLIGDRTNWRRMLKGEIQQGVDLVAEKRRLAVSLSHGLDAYVSPDDTVTRIRYPVLRHPRRIRSVSLDREDAVSGVIVGIKGQYLLFDDDRVLNVRRHTGYVVSASMN